MNPNHAATTFTVASGSAAYSNTMAAQHELFDHTGTPDLSEERWRLGKYPKFWIVQNWDSHNAFAPVP